MSFVRPRELVGFDLRHVTCSPPKLGGIKKLLCNAQVLLTFIQEWEICVFLAEFCVLSM